MPETYLPTVLDNRRLTETVHALRLQSAELARAARPGQFVHIKCGEGNLLRRPVSICRAEDGVLTVVLEVRGEGTRWLSQRRAGDMLDVLGPLGRGFDLSHKNIIVVGGGIGVPPMLFAARAAGAKAAVLGFRSRENAILAEEFRDVCEAVYITTDDGSLGEHGTVAGPLERLLREGGCSAVLACGPRPMLQAAAALAETYKVPCQVSLEERMGCGVGACLVCACKTVVDGKEKMRRVCKDGPVFPAEEVVW
ncbi:dihydroorotate dehydrogenase electron transfer subunit [Sporobacter termitidis DSM 10068]|uniref:Dihydroorotate dehydrogenase B (NAD(+)), electron transfer subunit n=1 Tax=Sporobacter termitidis DSM 10068 TaxID=1123282 RepID=A0A1M5X5B7_9FIRM|nr:dihydroorotate dehydrogenase electron transfer subunit [Sporobacter termitidis]SHH95017.1 dihydroorotate dehydrogenase electron transfer subunit [Sporobacter termitidis DSM 10068]